MPTVNPRVQVTLSPSLDNLVRRLALHQRTSKSQILRDLLEAAEPALERAAALMDAASKAAPSVLSGFAKSLQQAQDVAEDMAAVTISRLDRLEGDLVSQAEAVRGRRPARGREAAVPHPPPSGGAPGAPNPPASNRGVKSRYEGQKTPARRPSGTPRKDPRS